ncbi:MAG: HypC/HybG/HupF family hydrogenase formation chaperone [Desulfobacteraceae bacterium]|nr:HypC/HybG/HupF family hydrogenase formation chaperone [Desulfobacteraceae bacterium]
MCLAIPSRVIRTEGDHAVVDVDVIQRRVNIQMLSDVSAGDYIIVHAGYGLEKLDEQAAAETLSVLREALACGGENFKAQGG